ncbi:MAG: lanthionine synthetase LanC family protein [Pyrinomonadaceae bacterium]
MALRAASRIGRRLCATAFWDEDGRLCTWMGRTDVEDSSGAGYAAAVAALGPHLYGGTAGVALFLLELYGRTQDEDAKRTAEGALRRSAKYLRTHDALTSPLSFFLSHVGVAYVCARFMDFGLCEDLRDDAHGMLDKAVEALAGEHLLDGLGGNAGAIPALLSMAERPGFERCLALARDFGQDLCRSAVRDGQVCYWEATRASGESFQSPPMTGLSHGACGMALALFELYARTGEVEFLRTARAAFAYEDSFFNPMQSNWLDLRFPHGEQEGAWAGTFQTTWCHGAPGIGLTRLRAMKLDPERAEGYDLAARAALATTVAAVGRSAQAPGSDSTLCHGLSGLCEIALIFAEAFDDEGGRALVAGTMAELIRRHDEAGDWPAGNVTGGFNPTLMIGAAGVGHHLLRLSAPKTVPPVLIIKGKEES